MPLNLNWVRCGEHWCKFETVDLSNVTGQGVYIIWYQDQPGRVVRVGQGNIAPRIREHRQDPEILAYRHQGLLVTWASVGPASLDGVERYFADNYPPLTGDRFPRVHPITVNSPWT